MANPDAPEDVYEQMSLEEGIGVMESQFELINADCVEAMKAMPANSIDAIVTDPPYGLEFMGKKWDKLDWRDAGSLSNPEINRGSMTDHGPEREGANPTCRICGGRARGENKCMCEAPFWIVEGRPLDLAKNAESRHIRMQQWHQRWGEQAIRVLKPGGHIVSFSGTRTFHRLTCALEDAGFEIRDCLMWLYGSGFPKSRNISKAIDKEAGLSEQRGYIKPTRGLHGGSGVTIGKYGGRQLSDTPVSDAAKQWSGWGTTLKPCWEPIVLARKQFFPLSVAANVQKHGTGAMNIDACRLEGETPIDRWPPNVAFDEDAAHEAMEVSRFFYTAKASTQERNAGLYGLKKQKRGEDCLTYTDGEVTPDPPRENFHPTVKPVALMGWLCKLITQPGGTILDPFMGSGSTGLAATRLGFKFVGIEREEDYITIARRRIEEDAPMFNRPEN